MEFSRVFLSGPQRWERGFDVCKALSVEAPGSAPWLGGSELAGSHSKPRYEEWR